VLVDAPEDVRSYQYIVPVRTASETDTDERPDSLTNGRPMAEHVTNGRFPGTNETLCVVPMRMYTTNGHIR